VGGLYQIQNAATGDRYIGRAAEFGQRWASHKHYLRKGAYKLPHLQAAWSKYGEAVFVFKPLVECSPADALVLEQLWLDYGVGEYNVSRSATTPVRVGDKLPPEHRARISASSRGVSKGPRPDVVVRNKSSENKAKVSAALRGVPKPWLQGSFRTLETRAKMRAAWTARRVAHGGDNG
jgi:group I intron endonuclease